MPRILTEVDILRDYLRGVMDRAGHHALNVNEIILTIAGAVIWRKDDDPLEVMTREDEMKNVLWFKVNGQRYALSYNHDTDAVELREGTTQGNVIESFSNATPGNRVSSVFGGL
jgi:hypothetical protein